MPGNPLASGFQVLIAAGLVFPAFPDCSLPQLSSHPSTHVKQRYGLSHSMVLSVILLLLPHFRTVRCHLRRHSSLASMLTLIAVSVNLCTLTILFDEHSSRGPKRCSPRCYYALAKLLKLPWRGLMSLAAFGGGVCVCSRG